MTSKRPFVRHDLKDIEYVQEVLMIPGTGTALIKANKVHLWDMNEMECLKTFDVTPVYTALIPQIKGKPQHFATITFHPHSLMVWNLGKSGEEEGNNPPKVLYSCSDRYEDPPSNLVTPPWSSGLPYLLCSFGHAVVLFDALKGVPLSRVFLSLDITSMALFSQRSKSFFDIFSAPFPLAIIATRDGNIEVWDVKAESRKNSFVEGSDRIETLVPINSHLFLSAQYQPVIKLWDIKKKDGLVRTFEGHTKHVVSLRMLPGGDGKDDHRFVTASLDNTIRYWSTARDTCLDCVSLDDSQFYMKSLIFLPQRRKHGTIFSWIQTRQEFYQIDEWELSPLHLSSSLLQREELATEAGTEEERVLVHRSRTLEADRKLQPGSSKGVAFLEAPPGQYRVVSLDKEGSVYFFGANISCRLLNLGRIFCLSSSPFSQSSITSSTLSPPTDPTSSSLLGSYLLRLPEELQVKILKFTVIAEDETAATSLSDRMVINILNYAAHRQTLGYTLTEFLSIDFSSPYTQRPEKDHERLARMAEDPAVTEISMTVRSLSQNDFLITLLNVLTQFSITSSPPSLDINGVNYMVLQKDMTRRVSEAIPFFSATNLSSEELIVLSSLLPVNHQLVGLRLLNNEGRSKIPPNVQKVCMKYFMESKKNSLLEVEMKGFDSEATKFCKCWDASSRLREVIRAVEVGEWEKGLALVEEGVSPYAAILSEPDRSEYRQKFMNVTQKNVLLVRIIQSGSLNILFHLLSHAPSFFIQAAIYFQERVKEKEKKEEKDDYYDRYSYRSRAYPQKPPSAPEWLGKWEKNGWKERLKNAEGEENYLPILRSLVLEKKNKSGGFSSLEKMHWEMVDRLMHTDVERIFSTYCGTLRILLIQCPRFASLPVEVRVKIVEYVAGGSFPDHIVMNLLCYLEKRKTLFSPKVAFLRSCVLGGVHDPWFGMIEEKRERESYAVLERWWGVGGTNSISPIVQSSLKDAVAIRHFKEDLVERGVEVLILSSHVLSTYSYYGNNNFTWSSEHLLFLCEVLKGKTPLREVDLSGTKLASEEEVRAIFESVTGNDGGLEGIDLGEQAVVKGGEALVEELFRVISTGKLKYFRLNGTDFVALHHHVVESDPSSIKNLGEAEMNFVCCCLKSNFPVHTLNLSGNHVLHTNPEMARLLTESVAQNKHLLILDLSYCCLNERDAVWLSALAKGSSLRFINLDLNDWSDGIVREINGLLLSLDSSSSSPTFSDVFKLYLSHFEEVGRKVIDRGTNDKFTMSPIKHIILGLYTSQHCNSLRLINNPSFGSPSPSPSPPSPPPSPSPSPSALGFVVPDIQKEFLPFRGSEAIYELPCQTEGRISKYIFLSHSNIIVTGDEKGCLLVWKIGSGETGIKEVVKCVRKLEGHKERILQLVELPEERVLSVSNDGTWKIWNSSSGECLLSGEHKTRNFDRCVNPLPLNDGKLLLLHFFTSKLIKIFDYSKLEFLCSFEIEEWTFPVAQVSPTLILLVKNNHYQLWDLENGENVGKKIEGPSDNIFRIGKCVVLDDGRVVSAVRAGDLSIWDPRKNVNETFRCFDFKGGKPIGALAVCPGDGGQRVISGGNDQKLRVWDIEKGECLGHVDSHSRIEYIQVLGTGWVIFNSQVCDVSRLEKKGSVSVGRVLELEDGRLVGFSLQKISFFDFCEFEICTFSFPHRDKAKEIFFVVRKDALVLIQRRERDNKVLEKEEELQLLFGLKKFVELLVFNCFSRSSRNFSTLKVIIEQTSQSPLSLRCWDAAVALEICCALKAFFLPLDSLLSLKASCC